MAKIAFITGASSGIGKACAYKFAQGGYTLLLNALSEDKLQAIQHDIQQQYGVDVLLLPFDVTPAPPELGSNMLIAVGIFCA